MKKFLSAAVCAALLFLSACTPQSDNDIHEFLRILNASSALTVNADELKLARDGELIRYSHLSDGVLLCFYADVSGIIVRCTASALKKSDRLVSDFSAVCGIFTEYDNEKTKALIEAAVKNGKAVSDGYCLAFINNQAGCTFILSREEDELNTNEYPTLKKYIRKEDISRPTIGREEKTSNHN